MSSQKINLISFILAIMIRSFFECLVPDLPTDKVNQLTTGYNLSKGKGISLATPDMADISKSKYEAISLWPPAVACVSAMFFKLGFSWVSVAILIDVLSIVILFGSLYLMFHVLKTDLPRFLPVSIFAYLALDVSPFRHLYSSDLMALSFVCLGLLALIFFIKEYFTSSPNHLFIIPVLLSIAAFLPSFVRYAYYPISFLIGLIFLIFSYFQNRKLLKHALLTLLLIGILIVCQIVFLKTTSGDAYYLNEYHPEPFNKPYFSNLVNFNPIFVDAFLDHFVVKRMIGKGGYLFFLYSFSLLVIFLLSIHLFNLFKINKSKELIWSTKNWTILSGLLIAIINVLFLITLSLRYPHETNEWTYVREPRYYAVTYLFFSLTITSGCFSNLNKIAKYLIFFVISFSILFSLTVNFYLITKYSVRNPALNLCNYYHYNYQLYDYLRKEAFITSKKNLVVFDMQHTSNIIDLFWLQGFKIASIDKLPTLKSSKDVNLWIVIDGMTDSRAKQFVNSNRSKKLLKLEGTNVEIWEIEIKKNI